MWDKLKQQKQRLLDPENGGVEPGDEDSVLTCPSLTYQERLFGCITCLVLGMLLSIGSTVRLIRLVNGNPAPFAIAYTIGNLLSLLGTSFFVGPVRQVQTMFHAKRRLSAILFLSLIVLTLLLCFLRDLPSRGALVVLCVICQFMALIWFSLSYIPYGRNMALSCVKRLCGIQSQDEM